MVASETGVVLLDESENPTVLCEIVDEPGVRMNDGGCDPQGRFWCGTMAYDVHPGGGSLYRVEPDGSVRDGARRRDDLERPRLVSPTAPPRSTSTRWPTASTASRSTAASGELAERRRFAEIESTSDCPTASPSTPRAGSGSPSGTAARCAATRPTGALDAVVPLPCGRVTACAFGGDDLAELFITTSRLELAEGVDPQGGALFRCEPGVRGQPCSSSPGSA